ncbi:hypothetical protein BST81_00015 [Leptolyngbya sp. 'hensonii']|uniref:hypothetical protein n=1 Tax=Leptolyngbya sp. 'hensonii' TaxID=1922337 RepID=UPI00094FE973|nr:hypothetical protein [Leptolyngbya sp. 'hensonii']OLP20437.1 hypothetical protein BST81_00015 [Leptolyngbya sp. 'hensonii']
MPIQNTNRRLTPSVINQDIEALNGLGTIVTYSTTRTEATSEALQAAYQNMIAQRQTETERQAMYRAASDLARLAEWEFHNAVLAMKEVVKGQYGSDSNEAQSIGLKKKSDRRRPTRSRNLPAAS